MRREVIQMLGLVWLRRLGEMGRLEPRKVRVVVLLPQQGPQNP